MPLSIFRTISSYVSDKIEPNHNCIASEIFYKNSIIFPVIRA